MHDKLSLVQYRPSEQILSNKNEFWKTKLDINILWSTYTLIEIQI